jgi:hypothetical protein
MFKLLILAMLAIAAIPFFARDRQELLVAVAAYLLAFPVLTVYALESPSDSSSSGYAAALAQPIAVFYVALISILAFIAIALIRLSMLARIKEGATHPTIPPAFSPVTENPGNKCRSSVIFAYNTINSIREYRVSGTWGSDVGFGDEGGSLRTIELPERWTPDLAVTVEWRRTEQGCDDPRNDRYIKNLKATVPIEPYGQHDTLQVMFLPNDEVKVYVMPYAPSHPDHPLRLGRADFVGPPEWRS